MRDYGYFGSGAGGYAHYMQSFHRNFGGGGGGGGSGCLGAAALMLLPAAGFFAVCARVLAAFF